MVGKGRGSVGNVPVRNLTISWTVRFTYDCMSIVSQVVKKSKKVLKSPSQNYTLKMQNLLVLYNLYTQL